MAELKTKINDGDVLAFLESVEDTKRREDGFKALDLMKKISGCEPKMWGGSIVGFDSYHYIYSSGREGDWPAVGFSPRKQALSLYIMSGFSKYQDLMDKLGKFKTGKSCLYVKKWEDIDEDILSELISNSIAYIKEKYP
jgi:hypothetical protein